MFHSYLVSASELAAVGLGALLYTVTGASERTVNDAQAPTSGDRLQDRRGHTRLSRSGWTRRSTWCCRKSEKACPTAST
jgi:hypothetical protein